MKWMVLTLLVLSPLMTLGQNLTDLVEEARGTPPFNSFNYAMVRASWTAPCVGSEPPCGSPAVSYVLQLRYAQPDTSDWETYATTDTTFVDVNVPLFEPVQARVAGVDALDRQGPWSLPSEWYVADFGPVGTPTDMGWVIDPPGPSKQQPDRDNPPIDGRE